MAETTEQYRNRINQLKTSIENEPYMKNMRPDIAEGISKTGNRQADIEVRQDTLEEDFVAVQQDASSVSPSGAEVTVARGGHSTLDERLTKKEQEVTAQFAQYNKLISNFSDNPYVIGNIDVLLAAINRGMVNITFWGDSITAGADSIDGRYIYVNAFVEKLRKIFPEVVFNFYNYGVGGTNIQQAIDNTYIPTNVWWASITGQSWREYIRKSNPDLLVYAFGMNTIENSQQYSYYLELTKYYIDSWVKKPSIALITNYLPNLSWTGKEERNKRIHSMRVTRTWAKPHDYSLIDVGARYRTYVDGVEENSYIAEKFVDYERFSLNNNVLTSIFEARNFVVQFDTVFSGTTNLSVKFGKLSELKITNNSIGWYVGGYIVEGEKTVNISQTYHSLKVERIDQKVTVSLDGNVRTIITGFEDLFDGNITLQKYGESIDFSNFTGIAYFNTLSKSLLNEEDVLGKYVVDDYSTKLPFGGNGVNHPTTKNIEYVYKPEIDKFIDSVYKETTNSTAYYLDLPKRLLSTEFNNVASSGWGSNGGLNDSGKQLKFYTFADLLTTLKLNKIRKVNSTVDFAYQNLSQSNVNQLKDGEFTIINPDGTDYLILVNPVDDYDFYELKSI